MVFGSIIPSTPEIVIILVIALIVFGPQKLPEIGKQVGSALRELNKMRGDVQRAFDFDELTRTDYGNTHQYDSAPYGAAYPVSTYESTPQIAQHDSAPLLEHDQEHVESVAMLTSPVETESSVTAIAAEYVPHTVSVSAGAAVAHDLDLYPAGHGTSASPVVSSPEQVRAEVSEPTHELAAH